MICLVVLIYVFFGGMRGTAWANTFQTIVFMVLGVVTFFVIANRLGRTGVDHGQPESVWPSRFPKTSSPASEMSKTKFFTYLLIPLSVGMFPHLFQHWMTAKNANTFKLPVVCHPIFIMIVWVPCVLVGIWATGRPDSAPSHRCRAIPIRFLPFLVKTQTGPILGGLLAAGILAAIMSSLDSQFLCIGTIFNNDIVTHYLGKDDVSDQRQVLFTRLFIIGIVAITYLLSLGNVRSVFAMGVWCFSGFSALFPIVVAALYWRGLTAAGAISGIFAAITSWCDPVLPGHPGADFGRRTEQVCAASADWRRVLRDHAGRRDDRQFAITMVVVSLVTPKPNDETLAKFFA